MLMTQHSRAGKTKDHHIVVTYVGPYVRVQCSCQEFNILKRKELSEHAAQAAREHIAANRIDTPPSRTKYADHPGPGSTEAHEAYRRIWYPSDATPFDPALIHGGSGGQHNPRHEKYHRLVVQGIRVR